jgi:hypothetical protein
VQACNLCYLCYQSCVCYLCYQSCAFVCEVLKLLTAICSLVPQSCKTIDCALTHFSFKLLYLQSFINVFSSQSCPYRNCSRRYWRQTRRKDTPSEPYIGRGQYYALWVLHRAWAVLRSREPLVTETNVAVITWILTLELTVRFLVSVGHMGDVIIVRGILVEIPTGK